MTDDANGAMARQLGGEATAILNLDTAVVFMTPVLLHVHECSLAHGADCHDTAGDRDGDALAIQFVSGASFILLTDFSD